MDKGESSMKGTVHFAGSAVTVLAGVVVGLLAGVIVGAFLGVGIAMVFHVL